jgi:transcription initiation factor TFIIIB Brf1 subunit/transcription initiation factor TFIIB
MADFAIFEKALNAYNKKNNPIVKIDKTFSKSCSHTNTINEDGIICCQDCGEEILKHIMHEKEWRYYGKSDTKNSSDPNRVQIRKSDDRNIYNDVKNMGFNDKIVCEANIIYTQVTEGNIKRGNSRKGIIFACIFQSYKLSGSPQLYERLMETFNLDKRTCLKGLRYVSLNAPKTSRIHTTHITPIDLVKDIMDKFKATPNQVEEVIYIYDKIKDRDKKLNRARPQSIASGIVYYWIIIKNKDITLKEFTKKVSLSELTISRMAKIIAKIMKTPDVL